MNVYDMLRLMVRRGPYSEHEVRDMYACIDHAERVNLFGGIALEQVQDHTCTWDGNKINPRCLYCRKPI